MGDLRASCCVQNPMDVFLIWYCMRALFDSFLLWVVLVCSNMSLVFLCGREVSMLVPVVGGWWFAGLSLVSSSHFLCEGTSNFSLICFSSFGFGVPSLFIVSAFHRLAKASSSARCLKDELTGKLRFKSLLGWCRAITFSSFCDKDKRLYHSIDTLNRSFYFQNKKESLNTTSASRTGHFGLAVDWPAAADDYDDWCFAVRTKTTIDRWEHVTNCCGLILVKGDSLRRKADYPWTLNVPN